VLLGDYSLTIVILMAIWVMATLGLNIITGYAGQFNLGIGIYMGTGAYTTAMLTTEAGWSFWAALPAALAAAMLMGLITGLPALRVREDFLATLTIGMVFVFESLLIYLPWFGGPVGIAKIPPPRLLDTPVGRLGYLILALGAALAAMLFARALNRSWLGFAWESIREDELATDVIGIRPPRFKLYAFAIGGAYAGLGGVLYAHFIRYITPYDFGFVPSIYILAMAVFGGLGTIRGAVFGAAFLTALPELFRFVQEYRNFIYGSLLVLMMLYQPQGLLGKDSLLWRVVHGRRPRGLAAPAA
jgi:branched-chain amino acid transport system permease protein